MNRIALSIAALAAGAAPSAVTAATPSACPGRTFDSFLAAFAESPAVQRAHVANPLISGRIDPDAQPEPLIVTRSVPAAALSFPVMPAKAPREADGLTITRTAKGDGAVEVLLAKADTGYQLRYLFRPTGGCWKLTTMSDESM